MNDAVMAEAEFAVRVRALVPHPLADMFPLIEGDDFTALVEDIRANSIRVAIVLHEGKILDGRNRYRAAIECGHHFTEKDFVRLPAGADAERYVISANLQRGFWQRGVDYIQCFERQTNHISEDAGRTAQTLRDRTETSALGRSSRAGISC